ncbi:MAG: NHL repeat-containing protein [Chloroflexota bacterium]
MIGRWLAMSAVCLSAAVPWTVAGAWSGGSRPSATTGGSHATWQVLGAARTLPTLYQPAGLAIGSKGNIYVADSGNFRVVELGPRGQLLAHFGDAVLRPGPAMPMGQIPLGPTSLAVNAQGTVYVADSLHRVIRVYSARHHLVTNWPVSIPGAAGMQLAVAIGGRGNVIVAIAAQTRCTLPYGPSHCATGYLVQRRSQAGRLLGHFRFPVRRLGATNPIISRIAVAVDSRGNVYVTAGGMEACYKDCRSFHYVVKHASNGRVLRHWGADELDVTAAWPSIAIGGAGKLFLADDFNHRIEKRTSRGAVVARWSLASIFPTPSVCSGEPQADGCILPSGVAVDRHGNLYASDPGANRILKFSPNGRLLAQWGTGGLGADRFWYPRSLALDAGGRLWVNDATNGRVQVLRPDGHFHVQFKVANAGFGMALDHQGNVYLGQHVSQGLVISKFSSTGRLLLRWGGLNLAELPSGIAVAPNGDIFVVSFLLFHEASRMGLSGLDILRLSPGGRELGVIHITYTSSGSGIAIDAQENSYIGYGARPRFEKYSRDGALLAAWGAEKSVAGTYPSPAGMTIDAAGNLYVASTAQDVIDEYSPDGRLLRTWGSAGSYPGQFHQPDGIAVGSQGSIYVADAGNHRIERLTR